MCFKFLFMTYGAKWSCDCYSDLELKSALAFSDMLARADTIELLFMLSFIVVFPEAP